MKAAELVEDFDLYPRNEVNSHNVGHIADALASGVEMPPAIIDKKTKCIIDGFHRRRAYIRVYGDEAEMPVIEKTYKNRSEMFLDAMRYNASHGAKLHSCDRTHCAIIAERLSIPLEAVAGALNMPLDKLGKLMLDRTAKSSGGLSVPLKRTVRHFAGRRMTKPQVEANERLSGMNQVFYANQLITLIESGMLDASDDKLLERLRVLGGLLDGVLGTVAS